MMTVEFITALFYEVDEAAGGHPQNTLRPTSGQRGRHLGACCMRSIGVGNRAFYRWLTRDYRPLFPAASERTRLFSSPHDPSGLDAAFLAAPTVRGVIDTYGIELIYPMREGRSPQQIGRKGLSNHRWIVGGKLCLLLINGPR